MRILSSILVCLMLGCAVFADDNEARISCKGKVVDADGKPVAGATVRAYQVKYPLREQFPVQAETTTGADGTFSLTWKCENAPHLTGMVIAKKEGMSLGWDNWYRRGNSKDAKPFEMTIQLGKPATLEGTVVTPGGSPVPDAKIYLIMQQVSGNKHTWIVSYPSLDWLTTTTSADGRFQFNDIPENATAAVIMTAPGMAKTIEMGTDEPGKQPQLKPGMKDLKITMAPEARITGKVINEADGKPIGGVKLLAMTHDNRYAMNMDTTESKPDGSFEFTELRADKYRILQLPEPNKTLEWVGKPVPAETAAGETTKDILVKLVKGGILEVTVTNAKTKEPVANAHVSSDEITGQTDNQGVVKLRMMPGKHKVNYVYCQGYLQQQQNEEVDIVAGETKKLALTLKPSPQLCGIVVDQAGKPAAGADVKDITGWSEEFKTGQDGKFSLVANHYSYGDGREQQIYVMARREADNLAGVVEVERDKSEDIKIKLQPAGMIECKVTDESGKPITNARAVLMIRLGNMGMTICQKNTDEKGQLKIEAIPAGEKYDLVVEGDKFGKYEQHLQLEDDETDPLKLDVELPAAEMSISGVVIDTEDKPIAGADVYVYGQKQSQRSAVTGKDGKFTLNNIVDDNVTIYANAQRDGNHTYGSVNTRGGDKDVKIILGQSATQPSSDEREKITSLAGKPLKSLESFGLKPAEQLAAGKQVLLCFWDMNQRPSRHAIKSLAQQADRLAAKGIVVVTVQTSKVDREKLDAWMKQQKIAFPAGCVSVSGRKAEILLRKWGVQHLPWLILTDDKHVIKAEGIKPDSLE